MAGIGEASAILGVAQIGLLLAQTLVTVIGDYRDAAVNINQLRDEVHLTSICLQQLGDLAKENKLIAGRGVLEATNLRERCRAVIWEIRMIIKKGDTPLHPDEITKEDIDVSYFTSFKWALWTKKKLDGPRLELDRLKDSMTLTFVTHMAVLASSEADRRRYEAQIPGYVRNTKWAEERWRNDGQPEGPVIPAEVLDAGPEEWQEYVRWKNVKDQPILELEELRNRLVIAGVSRDEIAKSLGISTDQSIAGAGITMPAVPEKKTEYQAWTLDPFVGRVKMPVTEGWLREATSQPQSSEEMWKVHSKLQPWYKTEVDELMNDVGSFGENWSLFSLKVIHRSFFRRNENPPSLQVIVKGDVDNRTQLLVNYPPIQSRMETRPEVVIQPISDSQPAAVPYTDTIEIESPETKMSDEELIQQQLDLYKSGGA